MFIRSCLMLIAMVVGLDMQVFAGSLKADAPTYILVKALDLKLFQAYNACDLLTLSDMVDENLEFYHDKDGLSVGRAAFLAAIKNYICHKVRRELVETTLEVYPLANYGAIELGKHTFCNMAETAVCKDETNGIGKFFMLWQKQGDQYRLTRIFSYDHVSDRERKTQVK